MVKGRSLLIGAGISVAILILLVSGMGGFSAQALSGAPEQTQSFVYRPDVIRFDMLKTVYGELEKPNAVFLHDQHTDALEKKNKDCVVCHLNENGRMSIKFMRLEDPGRDELTKIYCDNCTKCHQEMLAAGEKSGPTTCDECHKEKPFIKSSRVPSGFDKSLHYRHSTAHKNRCERCHHEYDSKSKKLVYAKDKEGTCRYCHKDETQEFDSEKRISMRLAAHVACVDCHLKNMAKNLFAGPVTCGGCHDLEQLKKIEKLDKVPRMKRNQPDVVLIKTGDKKGLKAKMYRVPFAHKAHEGYNDTCRVCHHADLKSCTNCHTLTGSKDGKYVNLKDAMHLLDTNHSCIGCHEMNQRNKQCAGCHAFMKRGPKQDPISCMKCHLAPPPKSTGVLYKAGEMRLARMLPEIWKTIFDTSHDVNIPKKVVMEDLVNLYEPVVLQHKEIIQYLKQEIKGSKLADYFHPLDTTLCQGCHHNSPPTGTPPRCGSCHGKPFNEKNLFMPGLKGAYHRQCMGCHDKMGIKKPANVECIGCHIEKKQ